MDRVDKRGATKKEFFDFVFFFIINGLVEGGYEFEGGGGR